MNEYNEDNQASHRSIIEALLIAIDTPLPMAKIMEITNLPEEDIRKLIEELNAEYKKSKRSFEIKEIAGGFQIYTLPEYAIWVGALHDRKSKLSKAALETLAIIAYHQPIIRADIEKVRGVDSTYMLEVLLQKNLIKTCGRLPVPGRPIKYGTTREFLRYFGIKDLSEMPREEDFAVNIETSTEVEEVIAVKEEEPDSLDRSEYEGDQEKREQVDEEDADLDDKEFE